MERHHPWPRLAALGLCIWLAEPVAAEPTIEVFTIAGQPVINVPPGVAVIELDAPGRLDAELSRDLPAAPDVAAGLMQERMASPEWRDIADNYADSYLGLARAWQLGVQKVPAVVIEGRYVIYGQPDVAMAMTEANKRLAAEGL